MYYVYRFLNSENSVIYVGKTKQELHKRFDGHHHLPNECYSMVRRIEYIECPTETDMSIKELYYINKHRSNKVFFNRLDVAEPSEHVEFSDEWKLYQGPLPNNFHNSINRETGFPLVLPTPIERKGGKKRGASSTSKALSSEEVNEIIERMTCAINEAETPTNREICLRNLVMFVMGVNVPIKLQKFVELKYRDLFDENDNLKPLEIKLNRLYKDETVPVRFRKNVAHLLRLYQKYNNLSYAQNSEDYMFKSRKGDAHLGIDSTGKIISRFAEAVSVGGTVGGESMRKTCMMHIYEKAENKIEALVFMERFVGSAMYSGIVEYLGLPEEEVDIDHYLSDEFSIGDIDFDHLESMLEVKSSPKTPSSRASLKQIESYMTAHPEASCGQIMSDLNVSYKTALQWVKKARASR